MPCNYQPEFGRLIPLRCLLALNTLDFELPGKCCWIGSPLRSCPYSIIYAYALTTMTYYIYNVMKFSWSTKIAGFYDPYQQSQMPQN